MRNEPEIPMSAKQVDVSKDQLHQEFNTVVTETEQLLKSLATAGNDKAGALRDGVAEGIAAATARLDQLRVQALEQANAAGQATDDYVRENPWRAIGIAAAVSGLTGLVAGLLIARR
jgi:ElaB/YqjD/DUF883 family membrane-anchored ribosome-binding protein